MSRLQRYKDAKQNRIEGNFNGIPLFKFFERFGEDFPVFAKGSQIMILGNSGSGKSQSWIAVVLFPTYYMIKREGYKAKFQIFLLEDTIEMFHDRLFCSVLFRIYGITIDPLSLNSMKKTLYSEDVESKFEDTDKIVDDILSYCTIHDTLIKPFPIYMTLRTVSNELGEHTYKDKTYTVRKEDGTLTSTTNKVYDTYIPKDPEEHIFVIIDNINNFASDEGDTYHQAIGKWYREYGRLQICKHLKYTIINIHQTALDAEKKQFDMRGDNIIDKIKPDLSGLGGNKEVQRDCHSILALFNPSKFGIDSYAGYNINRLKDKFRSIIVLKSNFSVSNVEFPFYFNGASSFFKELPLPKDMTEDIYKRIDTNSIKDI